MNPLRHLVRPKPGFSDCFTHNNCSQARHSFQHVILTDCCSPRLPNVRADKIAAESFRAPRFEVPLCSAPGVASRQLERWVPDKSIALSLKSILNLKPCATKSLLLVASGERRTRAARIFILTIGRICGGVVGGKVSASADDFSQHLFTGKTILVKLLFLFLSEVLAGVTRQRAQKLIGESRTGGLEFLRSPE